jgi:beta-lactamase class D
MQNQQLKNVGLFRNNQKSNSDINMLKNILTIALTIFTVNCYSSQPKEISELKEVFDKYKVDGSILIYHQNENRYMGYNLERCNIAFCPASTFKIPNTLIALESGVATTETVFQWNGEKRTFAAWEKDMTIEEAFKVSAVPVYQEIARRIGVDRMKYYTQLFHYGNLDVHAENIDKFWLEGKSEITQYQQVYFLQKLYNLQLPVSEHVMKLTKELMLYETAGNYKISGKTGWAIRQNESVTWFVGFVETDENVYIFATNVAPNKDTDLNTFSQVRIDLTKDVFKELKIIGDF